MIVVLLLVVASPVLARKWTDISGEFSVEAELVEAKDGNVQLKRSDGKIISVPVSKLSKADLDYLASIAKGIAKPDPPSPTSEEARAALEKLGGKFKFG